jgi:hypothetical protein
VVSFREQILSGTIGRNGHSEKERVEKKNEKSENLSARWATCPFIGLRHTRSRVERHCQTIEGQLVDPCYGGVGTWTNCVHDQYVAAIYPRVLTQGQYTLKDESLVGLWRSQTCKRTIVEEGTISSSILAATGGVVLLRTWLTETRIFIADCVWPPEKVASTLLQRLGISLSAPSSSLAISAEEVPSRGCKDEENSFASRPNHWGYLTAVQLRPFKLHSWCSLSSARVCFHFLPALLLSRPVVISGPGENSAIHSFVPALLRPTIVSSRSPSPPTS